MTVQEITDVGIMSGPAYGSAPLSADMQYMETYTSSGLNRKLKGIVQPGFYLGYEPLAADGLNVVVTSKYAPGGQGAASVDVNRHQITIQQIADLQIPVVAGKTTRIILEANYKLGTVTDQVNSNSEVKATRIFAQDLSVDLAENQLELCRVIVPSGATQVTQAMIFTNNRINRQVGVTLGSIYDSDDEYIAANLKGLKILKGLIDGKLNIDRNGADILDKAEFRKNIGLDQLYIAADGTLTYAGKGGLRVGSSGGFTSDDAALQIVQKTDDKAYFLRGQKSSGVLHWYIGQSSDDTDAVTWGNSVTKTWVILDADGTGSSNVSTMTYLGDLAVEGTITGNAGARITGPVNITAKGATAVGDLTGAALYVGGDATDGTQGITVRNYAPTLALIDATGESYSFRWRADNSYLRLDADNGDNGASWNNDLAFFNRQGHLSLAGGTGSSSRILALGSGAAGSGKLAGTSQAAAMAYANVGADATTRGIGFGTEMTIGDGVKDQILDEFVEFWGNSQTVNPNARVKTLSSFRSYDKTSTLIDTAIAFDGRQMVQNDVERWNLYMQGSAPNYVRGQTIIGGTDTTLPDPSVALKVDGDTRVSGALSVGEKGLIVTGPAILGANSTSVTPVSTDSSDKIATTAFVKAALCALAGSVPDALDTLQELADALGNDPHFSTTILNALAGKMDKAKNGSDIPDVAAFIKNLGLGELALRDVGTGPNQVPDMGSFKMLLSGDGYYYFPGGFLIQWGTANVPANSVLGKTINFKEEFPNSCVAAWVADIVENTNIYAFGQVVAKSRQSMLIALYGSTAGGGPTILNSSLNPAWVAIGY